MTTKPTEDEKQKQARVNLWEKRALCFDAKVPSSWILTAMLIICLLVTFGHIWWSYQVGCAIPIQRAGAAIVAIAIFSIAPFQWSAAVSGGGARLSWSGRPVAVPQFSNPYVTVPATAGAGTVIWGYGDLIGSWLFGLTVVCQ